MKTEADFIVLPANKLSNWQYIQKQESLNRILRPVTYINHLRLIVWYNEAYNDILQHETSNSWFKKKPPTTFHLHLDILTFERSLYGLLMTDIKCNAKQLELVYVQNVSFKFSHLYTFIHTYTYNSTRK